MVAKRGVTERRGGKRHTWFGVGKCHSIRRGNSRGRRNGKNYYQRKRRGSAAKARSQAAGQLMLRTWWFLIGKGKLTWPELRVRVGQYGIFAGSRFLWKRVATLMSNMARGRELEEERGSWVFNVKEIRGELVPTYDEKRWCGRARGGEFSER